VVKESQFPDAAHLHDTYNQGRLSTEAVIKQITDMGHIVVPVTIDIDDVAGCLRIF